LAKTDLAIVTTLRYARRITVKILPPRFAWHGVPIWFLRLWLVNNNAITRQENFVTYHRLANT